MKNLIDENNKYQLFIKSHPSEKNCKYGAPSKSMKYLDNDSIHNMLLIGDFIIGMGSILLIEFAILSDNIYSFRSNTKKEFIGDTFGITLKISKMKNIEEQKPNFNNLKKFQESFKGAQKRIIKFLSNY